MVVLNRPGRKPEHGEPGDDGGPRVGGLEDKRKRVGYAPFRREELCFLEWEDLDFSREVIHVRDEKRKYHWHPKRDGRTMDLHPKLMEVIQGIEPERSFVFPAPEAWDVESIVTERKELGRRAWRKIKTVCRALDLKAKDKTGSRDRRFPNGPQL